MALPPEAVVLQQSLEGHKAAVLALAFTKKGNYLLSASQDRSVRLWNHQTGALVKSYAGPHNQEVSGVAVSEDNSQFFSCGGDTVFFAWDVATAQVVRKFVGHDRKVNALALGPQSSVLLSASHDKSVRLWDLRSKNRSPIQVLKESRDSVLCVQVAGDEIATGSTDGCVRRYDVRRGQLCVDELLQPVGSLCFSQDFQCMLASTLDDSIQLLDRDTGHQLATYKGHSNKRFKVQSTLDESCSYVVSGSEDDKIYIWDLADSASFSVRQEHSSAVLCATFSGETLATASAEGAIRLWNTQLSAMSVLSHQLPRPQPTTVAEVEAEVGLPTSFGKQPEKRQRGNRGKKRPRNAHQSDEGPAG